MKILGVIPSRYGSTRFPGKPLANIDGKPMIKRVYEQCKKASSLFDVVVATDDDRILNCVNSFGGKAVLTSSSHESGTDRCAEVLKKIDDDFDVVINIQGDEPFINPEQINQLASCFDDNKTDIATLIKQINSNEELFNRNRPKVDVDENSFAKMFSREVIPVLENIPKEEWLDNQAYFKHIGIYGYRNDVLKKISLLPKSPIEMSAQQSAAITKAGTVLSSFKGCSKTIAI